MLFNTTHSKRYRVSDDDLDLCACVAVDGMVQAFVLLIHASCMLLRKYVHSSTNKERSFLIDTADVKQWCSVEPSCLLEMHVAMPSLRSR